MAPGHSYLVKVRLTAAGDATLPDVRLALQLPQGFTVAPVGHSAFTNLNPHRSPTAGFRVTPPTWAPPENVTVHATADLSRAAQREAGMSVTVS